MLLRARLAKLRTELLTDGASSGGGGEGFNVQRVGDGRVALVGFPSVGKSSLLNALTDTETATAETEFTTLTCVPGNLYINDTRIQLLDLPGIIEGAASGRGRGREVIAVARSADMVMMILDASREVGNQHRRILEGELEAMGIRLNKRPPNVSFKRKLGGGVKFNATVPLTKMGDEPNHTVIRLLHEFKIHNCELLIREDITSDELVDVFEGNRVYLRCLYVYNKIDNITMEEVETISRLPNSVVISVHLRLNLDELVRKTWLYLGLIRVYTKRRGQSPELSDPLVLSKARKGLTVEMACTSVSKELMKIFNYALVWGRSVRHSPQRVGLTHLLSDEDVFQIVAKTVTQQKHDKDYSKKVQDHWAQWHEKKKAKKKALKT